MIDYFSLLPEYPENTLNADNISIKALENLMCSGYIIFRKGKELLISNNAYDIFRSTCFDLLKDTEKLLFFYVYYFNSLKVVSRKELSHNTLKSYLLTYSYMYPGLSNKYSSVDFVENNKKLDRIISDVVDLLPEKAFKRLENKFALTIFI